MPLVRSEFFWRPPPGGPVETVFLVTDLGDYIVDDLGNYIVAVAGDQTEPPSAPAQSWDDGTTWDDLTEWLDD